MNKNINYNGQDWVNIRVSLNEKLVLLHSSLADKAKDIGETQWLRGQIAQIKEILGWEREPQSLINPE